MLCEFFIKKLFGDRTLRINIGQLKKFNESPVPLLEYFKYFSEKVMGEDPNGIKTLGKGLSKYSDYFFVIPNKTRWTCIQCGNCCKSLIGVIDEIPLNEMDCPRLVHNRCMHYLERPTACRTYPFHIVEYIDQDILLVDRHCKAVQAGTGYVITMDEYGKKIKRLNREYRNTDNIILGYGKR
jgi:Fe-S-cluster containining protein